VEGGSRMVAIEERPAAGRRAIRVSSGGGGGPSGEAVAPRAAAVAEELLADGEIVVLRLKPSLWFVPLVSGPVVGLGVLAILVGHMSVVSAHAPQMRQALVQAGVAIAAARMLWALLQWHARWYVLTDRRVIRRMGVLNVQVFECALDRVQNTFVCRSLVQRILGVGNIFFATAGTGQVEAMWQHVGSPGRIHKTIIETIHRYGRRGGGV